MTGRSRVTANYAVLAPVPRLFNWILVPMLLFLAHCKENGTLICFASAFSTAQLSVCVADGTRTSTRTRRAGARARAGDGCRSSRSSNVPAELQQHLNFWENADAVANLPDPPASELLQRIREKPFRGGYEPTWNIAPYHPRITTGAIPKDLIGTLSVNGPGRIRIGERQYGHWFDGDGYVTILNLDGTSNKASFSGNFVPTERYALQEKFMQQLQTNNSRNRNTPTKQQDLLSKPPLAFAGPWTLGDRGEWYKNMARVPMNPGNTATMWLPPDDENKNNNDKGNQKKKQQPRLYALCEGGHPIQLDPYTLQAIGEERPFQSKSKNNQKQVAVKSFFSAHFSKCETSGYIYNHGYILNPIPGSKQEINILKLSEDGNLLQQERSTMPYNNFVHDSCLTQNYLLYFLLPYEVPLESMPKFLTGQLPYGKLYEWNPHKKAMLRVHSKIDLRLKWNIELPEALSLYHLVDAHEEIPLRVSDGSKNGDDDASTVLKVRVAQLFSPDQPADRVALEEQFSDQMRVEGQRLYTKLVEHTFLLRANGTASLDHTRDLADDAALGEFPVINPAYRPGQQRRYCWTNAASSSSLDQLNGLQKIDMFLHKKDSEVITFGEESFCGAPLFVPKMQQEIAQDDHNEDDGYLIANVYRSSEHRTDVVILDASTMETLCLMELNNHVPFQFHGEFCAGFVGNLNG